MKFEIEKSLRGAPDEDVLADLQRCAEKLGRNTLTMLEYEEHGHAHPSMVQRRFRSWTRALELAGLEQSRSKIGISDVELFENIRCVWLKLGRQPRYTEVKKPLSDYSSGTYEKRFGGWRKSLEAFVTWVNSEDLLSDYREPASLRQTTIETAKRRTRREVSERQRFRILLRDGFRCLSCGASPLNQPGVELHVDHIKPWSKGGETVDANLESKCSRCNLGKGNAYDA